MLDTVLILLAALALLGVMFEEVLHVNKAKITLFFGTLAWMLLFMSSSGPEQTEHIKEEVGRASCRERVVWVVADPYGAA